MTQVLTHRGLDPSKPGYFPESSREAFTDHLDRGFGIEFDLQPDMRITHNPEREMVGGTAIDVAELLKLIAQKQKPGLISALHLKYRSQDKSTLDLLLEQLKDFDVAKIIIFDETIATAQYLKEKNPALQLAFSVSHPFDIERYNNAVGGTLYTIEEAIAQRALCSWVWLDEWDLQDKNGGTKQLYTQESFKRLHEIGLKIALGTPELHATSPGLLGGESHTDARDHATLMSRIREILALHPDAICTDNPDEVLALIVAL